MDGGSFLHSDLEITVGRCSYSSYASSEFSITESEQLERESLVGSEASARPQTTTEGGIRIMRSVQMLSQKIAEWIKSLDEEDDYVTGTRSQKSLKRGVNHL